MLNFDFEFDPPNAPGGALDSLFVRQSLPEEILPWARQWLGGAMLIYPVDMPCQCTLLTHPFKTPCQYAPSIYSVNALCRCTHFNAIHPVSTSLWYIITVPSYRCTLSKQHTLSMLSTPLSLPHINILTYLPYQYTNALIAGRCYQYSSLFSSKWPTL